MDFDVLPGPSLAELARTALARAGAATVSEAEAQTEAEQGHLGRPVSE